MKFEAESNLKSFSMVSHFDYLVLVDSWKIFEEKVVVSSSSFSDINSYVMNDCLEQIEK